jgi:hypothetical protein
MITIWVHNKYLDEFVKILDKVEYVDEVETKFYTYPKGKEYVQLLIGYDEYVQLKEKNNV